ncbi:uncharacterized protein LOC142320505 [Lycorma delicatula]|uniref:uncharacterized protein LOC142320505 n=1 Tax=Lycorma delicatula TaxID=130591 RepID=UPI003F513491
MYTKSQMHLTQQVLTHQEDLAHLVVCLAKLVQLLLDLGVPQTLLINHHLDSTPAIQLIILMVQILLNKNLLEKSLFDGLEEENNGSNWQTKASPKHLVLKPKPSTGNIGSIRRLTNATNNDEEESSVMQLNSTVFNDSNTKENRGLNFNKLHAMIPLKEENDPLSLDSNENCEGLMLIKKEEQGQIKQEESDLADEIIDDSVLENIEENIQITKYMTVKYKNNLLHNHLYKIFNEIDSASNDGFNDKTLVFQHDTKINNKDKMNASINNSLIDEDSL